MLFPVGPKTVKNCTLRTLSRMASKVALSTCNKLERIWIQYVTMAVSAHANSLEAVLILVA
jgi:hypothetical protein